MEMKTKKRGNSSLSEHEPKRVYMTIQDVSEYIKVARPTIYSWIAKGVLPFKYYLMESVSVKHRSYRFLKADIDAWMDGNEKIPAGVEYTAIP